MQAVVGALRAVLGLDSIAFEKGAQDAQKTLKGLDKSFNQMGASVNSMARSMNTALSSIGVGLSIGGLVAFQKSLEDWAAKIKDQAERLGISTDALQAYEFAAVKAGVGQEEFNKSLEFFGRKMGDAKAGVPAAIDDFKRLGVNLRDSKGELIPFATALQLVAIKIAGLSTAQAKQAESQNFFSKSGKDTLLMLDALAQSQQTLIDGAKKGGGIASPELLKHFDDMKKKAAELEVQWRVLVAGFAAEFEVKALEELNKIVESTKRELEALAKAWQWIKDNVLTGQAVDSSGLPQLDEREKKTKHIEELEKEAKEWRELAAALNITDEQRIRNVQFVRDIEKEIADLKASMPPTVVTVTPVPGGRAPFTGEPDPSQPPKGGIGGFNKVGGGQSPEERARATLKLWTEEIQVYQDTLTELSHNFTVPLDEVERKLESQRRLTKDIAATSKGISDPNLLAKIKAEAEAREGLRLQFEAVKKAAKDAETAEKAFGDGSVELAARQRELTAAYGTGRLSLEAMTIAMAEATRNAELQRLKMIGLTDQGWGGFFAGMRTAQMEWERANSAFAAGQKAFESVMSHMEDALAQFVATGKLNFRALANSIISDIIRMQLKMATTSLFGSGGLGSLFGGLGSLFSGGGGGGGGGGFSNAGSLAGFGASGFAAGGMPPIGQPSWVGERGPELWVPRAAGNIIPNDALGGGGMMITQNFNITGGDEAGVYRALNRAMPQMKKEVLDAVQDARSRGGKFSQTFRQ